MKKWKIALPTLLAASGLPLVSLVGCDSSEKVHIYFNNGGGGTIKGSLDIAIKRGLRWCDLVETQMVPEVKPKDGYKFDGWFRQGAEDPLQDSDETIINSNWSITAIFSSNGPVVTGGHTSLAVRYTDHTEYTDSTPWRLEDDGRTITGVTFSLVGESIPNWIEIDSSSGFISWKLPYPFYDEGATYHFLVQAEDGNGNKYHSPGIGLYVGPEETSSFATDSWETVCWWANAGLDALHSVYKTECVNNTFAAGTLIGIERTVELKGEVHKVVVVDENSDTYDKDGVRTPAALTFQFQNLVSGGDQTYHGKKMALFMHWCENREINASNYWVSDLENALNGTDPTKPVKWQNENEEFVTDEYQISVLQMIDDENLQNNIKLVSRSVATYTEKDSEGNPIWGTTTNGTKLFCPTISNYFSPVGLSNTDDAVINDKNLSLCLDEGQAFGKHKQYAYYAKDGKIHDTPIAINLGKIGQEVKFVFDCAWLTDVAGSHPAGTVTYWCEIGSPWLQSPGGDNIANINPNGGFCNYGDINDFNAVAPCFCI